mmetsp:Transcript_1120/g.2664  ORF Transcript_1120/g.2664 Transcript_1120/m.2664 type:complete len:186 (+) Transcript_1120:128-685(+)
MEESRHRILTGMASSVLVLDGGMGHELKMRQVHVGMEDQFLELSDFFLPGAFANRQRPDIVRSVHEEYIKSGAQIITTNNFVVTPYSLGKVGRASELTELTEVCWKLLLLLLANLCTFLCTFPALFNFVSLSHLCSLDFFLASACCSFCSLALQHSFFARAAAESLLLACWKRQSLLDGLCCFYT